MSLGHDRLAEISRDEFEPRGTDICPQCGSGHTRYYDTVKFAFWLCQECGSKWGSRAFWSVQYQHFIQRIIEKGLQYPKLSDRVEP